MKSIKVFNLEFKSYVKEFNIGGYRFYRADDYPDRLLELQHISHSIREFNTPVNTGTHSQTAYVEIPEKEEKSIFKWANPTSALSDILLLISIFTGRDVFIAADQFDPKKHFISADPRFYPWGGTLRASLQYIKSEFPNEDDSHYDIGFAITLNEIYSLLKSPDWQVKYEKGYFIFLARNAFKQHKIEAAFIQCWTIWEHLFALHNQNWLSEKQIYQMSSYEKISYVLVEYDFLNKVTNNSRERIKRLSKLRNTLIHNGRLPDEKNINEDSQLFIRLTESIIAKILGLTPSDVFNTAEKADTYFNKQ